MRCPKCACQDDKVIDSRSSREGATIRRRRECSNCAHRFTTYEQVRAASPEIETMFPRKLVYRLLADEEMTGTVARFRDVMQRFSADPGIDDLCMRRGGANEREEQNDD